MRAKNEKQGGKGGIFPSQKCAYKPVFMVFIMYSNIIRRSQISADTQLCRNMNTVLANAEAEGRIPGSVYDVLYLENEAGYIIENLNPTADDMYFAWDEEKNQMIYLMSDLETVYYPEEYTLTPGKCWITAGSAAEAAVIANKGFNIALEKDIDEEIILENVVSINTLGFKCGNVTFKGDTAAKSVETAYMIGQFGTIGGNLGAASIVTSGTATSVNVSSNNVASSVTVKGCVSSLCVTGASSVSVAGTGLVKSVSADTTASIKSSGVVLDAGGKTVTGGSSVTTDNKVEVGTKEDIESVRTQVATGERNFVGETIILTQDINMNGISFTPISSYYRKTEEDSQSGVTKDKNWFGGKFDGNNCGIIGLSNTGFSVTGITAGTNTTSIQVSGVTYAEAIYGLFASVYNAEIRNINVTVNIDMTMDNQRHWVGDCVGGLIGYAEGTCLFENITVNGSIAAYDNVGGIVGRTGSGTFTFKNCVNNATVTAVRKAGGIVGFMAGSKVIVEEGTNGVGAVNNGVITCRGAKYDYDLDVANDKGVHVTGTGDGSGYYVVGKFGTKNSGATVNLNDKFTSNGKAYLAGNEVNDIVKQQ